jgi:succinate dehydrogenase / fumarate reductase iron-sulfur subunit
MMINRKIRLACRTQLESLKGRRISIEPLPGLRVLKDLVVDMEPFWESYRSIRPWLEEKEPPPEKEQLMSEATRKKIDQYVNCILCAACYGACPVVRMDKDRKVYLGPAALAKAYRFLADPRGESGEEILRELDSIVGVWGCHQVLRCTYSCPKDVRPSDGIMGLRRKIVRYRFNGSKSSEN